MIIPEGKYRAKARKAELGESSNGNEQVGIEFEIIDGDHKGSRYSYYGTFTEKAAEYTVKAMRGAGWVGDDVTDLSTLNQTDGPECQIVIRHEEYEGKTRVRIMFVNPVGGLAMKNPLTQEKRQSLAQRIRSTVAAVDQDLKSSGNGAASQPKAAGDIPF